MGCRLRNVVAVLGKLSTDLSSNKSGCGYRFEISQSGDLDSIYSYHRPVTILIELVTTFRHRGFNQSIGLRINYVLPVIARCQGIYNYIVRHTLLLTIYSLICLCLVEVYWMCVFIRVGEI